MTYDEAQAILCYTDGEGGRKPLVDRLRAHATLWAGASPPIMQEHRWYCDEAATRIEKLQTEFDQFRRLVRALYADPPNPEWIGRNATLIQDCCAAIETFEAMDDRDDITS